MFLEQNFMGFCKQAIYKNRNKKDAWKFLVFINYIWKQSFWDMFDQTKKILSESNEQILFYYKDAAYELYI